MKTYQFDQTQFIKSDIETVWSFFSSPKNLIKITPLDMNFKIVEISGSEEIHKGQLIKYKVSPFPFLRVSWVTEITDLERQRFFEDAQREGPFKEWVHRHYFSPEAGGVWMRDQVSYSMPFGFIGTLANELIIRDRVLQIFEHRRRQIELIFPQS